MHVHPEDKDFVSAATQAALAGRGPLNLEHRVLIPGKQTTIWVRVQGQLVKKENGQASLIGITQNITERKLAEDVLKDYRLKLEQQVNDRTGELKESRDLVQSLVDTTLVQMSILKAVRDQNGSIRDFEICLVNKELERQTGRSDLVGKRYAREYPGIRKKGIFDLILKTIETGEPHQLEYFYPLDGFNHWFSSMFVKLNDGVVATNMDITARKQAEEERFRNFLLLQQSEEVANSGSWDFDVLTGTFCWSNGMYRLFDLQKGIEVKPDIYLAYATSESQAAAQRVVDHINSGDEEFEETLEIAVADQLKILHLKAMVVKNDAGQPVRVLGVDLDISATREAERRLRQLEIKQQQEILHVTLNTQEEERRRISESLHNGLGQLLYGTRLNMNYLTVKMALKDPAKFDESRAYTAGLLTDSIKETRRISHELMPTVLAEFGLAPAIKDICDQLQDGIRFDCKITLDNGKLDNYLELAVYRSVQELMINVVKHAKATLAMVIVTAGHDFVIVRVSDNGIGMPSNQKDKTGIGITSIRNKVELLKGTMDISCKPGKGTTVELRLPLHYPLLFSAEP